MIVPLTFFSSILLEFVDAQCRQCMNYPIFRFKNMNMAPTKPIFNFEHFFNSQKVSTPQFSSYASPNQRVFNMYGQDPEAFGSAIGKSIAQRIQQAMKDSSTSATDLSSSESYTLSQTSTSPVYSPSTSSSMKTTPSIPTTSQTHPPEDLPTVQQAFAPQQPSTLSQWNTAPSHQWDTTPSHQWNYPNNPIGFNSFPGMIPHPSNAQIGYDPIRKVDVSPFRNRRDQKNQQTKS